MRLFKSIQNRGAKARGDLYIKQYKGGGGVEAFFVSNKDDCKKV